MNFNEDDVREKLKNVDDPELEEDIVTLEMVEEIEVEDGEIELVVDFANESLRRELAEDVKREVAKMSGVESLRIEWAGDDGSSQESEMLPDVDKVIAVSSGKGGVGKSTVAVNMACALAKEDGVKAGILDADVYGPNVPRMFGPTEQPKVTKEEEIIPPEKHDVKVMSMGYLTGEDSPVVWRGAMVHKALTQLLGDVRWGELDYLIVDLPPGTGDAQLTIAQTIPVTGAVIVTTPQDVSIDDARKGVEMFNEANVDVAGIIENMSDFICTECGEKHEIFGEGGGKELAHESDVDFLGSVPLNPEVRTSSDKGLPVVYVDDSQVGEAFEDVAENTGSKIDDLDSKKLPMV
ncbi:MAG: P-loop NTPase [Halobacteria archaeon]